MSFWYNVDTGQVETDENRSRGEQVLGPYATEAEARAALDTAHKKTEQWDAEDRDWNQRGRRRRDDGEPDEPSGVRARPSGPDRGRRRSGLERVLGVGEGA